MCNCVKISASTIRSVASFMYFKKMLPLRLSNLVCFKTHRLPKQIWNVSCFHLSDVRDEKRFQYYTCLVFEMLTAVKFSLQRCCDWRVYLAFENIRATRYSRIFTEAKCRVGFQNLSCHPVTTVEIQAKRHISVQVKCT
jgi:hypothetical protein